MIDLLSEPPPDGFNMARYCLGAGAPRDPGKTALILAADADAARPPSTSPSPNSTVAVRSVAAGSRGAASGRASGW